MLNLNKIQVERKSVPPTAGISTNSNTLLNFIWLELTQSCNLHCIHCYSESSPRFPLQGEMVQKDWQRVMSEARKLGCTRLQFIGGEVLLVPYLKELIGFARSVGFSYVEVFSNVTLLDDCTIDTFQEAGIQIATSFYCHKAEVHDRITHHAGSWHRTLTAIDCLVQRKIPLRVGIIEMDDNRAFVRETVTFLKNHGVTNISIDHVRSFGRATSISSRPSDLKELCGHCGNGRVCVTASGEVFPCIMSRDYPIGNVLTTCLPSAFKSDALKKFSTSLGAAKINRTCSPETSDDCVPKGCYPDDLSCSPVDDCTPSEPRFKANTCAKSLVRNQCEPSTGEECLPDNCSPDYCCEPNEPQPE